MRCASKIIIALSLNSQKRVSTKKYTTAVDLTKSDEISAIDVKSYVDFKKYLRAHNVRHKEGYTCLHLECRLCNRQQQTNRQLWSYINKKTGSFYCPNCDVSKSLNDAMESFRTSEFRLQFNDVNYKSRVSDLSPVTQDACDKLKLKGLKAEQLNAINVRYSPQQDLLHFTLKNAAQLVVGEKLLFLQDGREETFQSATNSGSGLLIHGSASKSKALLTSNLLDFIVLATTKEIESHSVIGLPYALQQLPLNCLPALENFKELVFWFNFDLIGWDAAKTFAGKINEKRCLLIRPTEKEPAPHMAFRQRLNLKHIIAKATPVLHQSVTTFRALRNDILSELQNIEKVDGVKWKRFPVLNKLLKGHRKGELTILTGPTGSGKTTFISEYSLDLAMQGVSTLWGSFEIRNSRLASTLLHQYVGYSLADKLHEFEHWATKFESLPLYFTTFHGQQQLKVVMEAVEHTQYAHDISHVIIDNLQFMMGVSSSHRSDKYWEQDSTVAAFRTFATKHNVHVTLVMHPRKERHEDDLTINSVFGTAKATQEADNVLIIQDKRLSSVRCKKFLQIAKNRYNGELGVMPLEFDKDALSYASTRAKKKDVKKSTT